MMQISPRSTLAIIKELERLGFNNEHFQQIHHWGNCPGKDSSLESHKEFLSTINKYQLNSNNFKVAQKLHKCFDLANRSKGRVEFKDILDLVCDQSKHTKTKQKEQLPLQSLSGLYVVTLNNKEKISANANDKRIAHKAIRVNQSNCKFGKAVDLEKRKNNYYKTFGRENVNFTPIASLLNIDEAEKEILKQLNNFRLASPSGNLTEWLTNIDQEDIIELTIKTLDCLKLSYELLCDCNLEKKSMVNFSAISKRIANKFRSIQKPAVNHVPEQVGFQYKLPSNYQFDENAKEAYHALTVEKKPVIFLTGRAGTGKTTFIHYVKQNYPGNSVILTSYGMAALNIGGQTIHSFFRFPVKTFENEEIPSYYNSVVDHLDLIIIDEISIVQSDMLDHIDFALRKWRRSSKPFGGIQLLMVGDCFQLSPWIKFGAEKKRYEHKYRSQMFFDAHVFEKVDVHPINLTKVYRQHDQHFINILNRISSVHDKKYNRLIFKEGR